MGAIQSAINQSIGAVMGGAIAAEHLTEKINTKQKESLTESAEVHKQMTDLVKETDTNREAIVNANDTLKEADTAYKNKLSETEAFINEKHSRHTEGEKKGKFMSKADKAQELIKRQHDIEKLGTAAQEAQKNLEALVKQRSDIKDRLAIVNARNDYNKKTYGKYGYNSKADFGLQVVGASIEDQLKRESEARKNKEAK